LRHGKKVSTHSSLKRNFRIVAGIASLQAGENVKIQPHQSAQFFLCQCAEYAQVFIQDLARRLPNRVQLTSDGHKAYLQAVENAFGLEVDYSMLVTLYGPADGNQQERRYSAGHCCGTIKGAVCGDPDPAHVRTSFVERQNLSLRMGNRRFTRLTNGFSKKAANHEHSLAIYYMHYNFGRVHKSLRVTPAMEAGISDHVWTLEEIAGLTN
jgi:hypothetical protein